jgi:hypothetical protein
VQKTALALPFFFDFFQCLLHGLTITVICQKTVPILHVWISLKVQYSYEYNFHNIVHAGIRTTELQDRSKANQPTLRTYPFQAKPSSALIQLKKKVFFLTAWSLNAMTTLNFAPWCLLFSWAFSVQCFQKFSFKFSTSNVFYSNFC